MTKRITLQFLCPFVYYGGRVAFYISGGNMKFSTIGYIYYINNIVNDKKYIGQTIMDIKKRWSCHRQTLKSNKHDNSHLQNAWNKYGEDKFEFVVIEKYPIEMLDEREIYWIKKIDTTNRDKGYNIDGGGNKGKIISEERRIQMTKRKHSDKTIKKMSDSNKGRIVTDETKKKMSLSRNGIKLGEHINVCRKHKNSSSKFFGLSLHKTQKDWICQIHIKEKIIFIGRFKNELEAARAYDKYIIDNNLDRPLNFPNNSSLPFENNND
jgi:group I intron endonuclease